VLRRSALFAGWRCRCGSINGTAPLKDQGITLWSAGAGSEHFGIASFMTTDTSTPASVPLRESIWLEDGTRCEPAPDHLLGVYLAQHPLRVREMLRLVPEAAGGIHAHWNLVGERLSLDRVEVKEAADPFISMVLWHALFPGLRTPLVPWWASGIFRSGTAGNNDEEFNSELELEQGKVVYFGKQRPATVHWSNADPHLWPLWVRLAGLPVLFLATPALIICVLMQRPRFSSKAIRLIIIRLPLLLVLFPLHALFPGFRSSFIRELVRPIQAQNGMEQLLDDARRRDWKGRRAIFGDDDASFS
jgi:hypothetical protein